MTNYKRGQNPRSHHNQARTDHPRVVIPVTCDRATKRKVDEALRGIKPMYRSRHIIKLILKAIADGNTELYPKGKSECDWQISIPPETQVAIYKWCKSNLPPRCRSRWIVNLIINQHTTIDNEK